MPLILSKDQQKALLQVYIEISFLKDVSISDHERYRQVNGLLRSAEIPLQLNKPKNSTVWSVADIKNQLGGLLYRHVSGDKLHDLFYSAYDALNEKHHFDAKPESNADRHKLEEKKTAVCFALRSLTSYYYSREIKQSEARAITYTALFCLAIVTIPFAKFFYHSKMMQYRNNHFFQQLFIDDKILNAVKPYDNTPPADTTRKVKMELYQNYPTTHEKNDKFYGLINKCVHPNNSYTSFKHMLFSKNNRIRKFLAVSDSGSYGPYGRSGITLLGTKDQIQKSKHKFEARSQEAIRASALF